MRDDRPEFIDNGSGNDGRRYYNYYRRASQRERGTVSGQLPVFVVR